MWGQIANALNVSAAGAGAVGGFYQAQAQQSSLRSTAIMFDLERDQGLLDARQLEQHTHDIISRGRRQASLRGMQGGMQRGAARASTAGRGVQVGAGSAAEIVASIDFAKESDVLAINMTTAREAARARTASTNSRNRARMAGVTANNLRRTAGTISPWLAAGTSLLGGAGSVAANWRS